MSDFTDNSAQAQRNRLLDALRVSAITTIEARRHLDIMMPDARIKELRDHGYQIETIRVWRPTESGKEHSVALYVLQPEALE